MPANEFRSGKSHRDENFPVASRLIHPHHRGPILAFYNFVRTADDIADHPTLDPQKKLEQLDALEQGLLGANDANPEAVALRKRINERRPQPAPCARPAHGIPHGRDQIALSRLGRSDRLLHVFRHAGRPLRARRAWRGHQTWPANDALCAALQIINHIQDCKEDYLNLDRVYIPQDAFAAAGCDVTALGKRAHRPHLRIACTASPDARRTYCASARRLRR